MAPWRHNGDNRSGEHYHEPGTALPFATYGQ
jgi:hypothetical protein